MREVRIAAESFTGSLGPVGASLGALSTTGVAGAAVIGLTAAAGALLAGTKAAVEYGAALNDQAKRIGLNVEVLQEYQFAARQTGASTEALQTGIQVFVRNLGQAQAGTGTLVKALKDTDQAFLDSVRSAGSTEEALGLVVQKIGSAGSAFEQARLLQAAFGRGAAELLPLFAEGAVGIERLRKEARELGIVIDESLIRGADNADDALAKLRDTIKGNLTAALLEAAPLLERAAEAMAKLVAAAARPIRIAIEADTFNLTNVEQQIAELEKRAKGVGAAVGDLDALEAARRERAAIIAARGLRDDAERAERENREQRTRQGAAFTAFEQAQEKREQKSTDPEVQLQRVREAKREELAIIQTAEREGVLAAKDAQTERLAIDRFFAEQKRQILEKAGADERAARKRADDAAKRAADDLAQFQKRVRDEAREADTAGLSGVAAIEAETKARIEAFSEEVRARVKDAKEADQLIADFRVEVEEGAAKRIEKIREDEAEKDRKRAEDLWEDQMRLDEQLAKEREREREKAEKDATQAAKEAARAAEQAAKEAARLAEEQARPFLDAAQSISQDLTSALVDSFLSGEDQARSTADVLRGIFGNLAEDLLRLFAEKALLEPLAAQLQGLFAGGGQGSGLLGGLGSLLGGGGGAAAAIPAGLTSLPAGVAGPVLTEEAATALLGTSSNLLSAVAGVATVVAALGVAGKTLADSRASFDTVTRGTAQAQKNALTGIQAGLVAGFTAGGAAIGSAVPLIGTAIGAAVGAAIGTAASSAIEKGVTQGIEAGVKEGVTQQQLEQKVVTELQDDLILNILSGFSNTIAAEVFGPLVTPDIEDIFAKIFRDVLGGPGGLNTEGIATGAASGLRELADEANRASRIIAESFGAGGEAFGPERERNFRTILLGGVAKRVKDTGEDAAVVLADAFVGAFAGGFFDALKAAAQTGIGRRDADFRFVAEQFALGVPSFGFNFQRLAEQVESEGNIPQERARRQSREAVAEALQAALADAADSQAFRKSLTASVQEAFAAGASKALVTGPLGEAFAPFFSVSNVRPAALRRAERRGDAELIAEIEERGLRNRRALRRARRQGDTAEQFDILSREFQADVAGFAAIVSDPAFLTAITDLNDQFLRLQVASAAAAGDIKGAADAIEQRLAPQIQLVRDLAQLQRDVRSRTALGLAGPGFAGERAQVDELRRQREETEQRFRARFGGAGVGDFSTFLRVGGRDPRGVEAFIEEIARTGQPAHIPIAEALGGDVTALLAQLREFADARLAELEAELALQRQLVDVLEQAERAFADLAEQAAEAAGGAPTFDAAAQSDAIRESFRLAVQAAAEGFEDPETVTALQDALSRGIAEAAARLQAFETLAAQLAQLDEAFADLGRSIATSLGQATDETRLGELRGDLGHVQDELAALLPAALAGDLEAATDASELLAESQQTLAEAASIAANRLSFFRDAVEAFADVTEGIDVSLGRVTQRQQLARRRAELDAARPGALRGNIEDVTKARTALTEAVGIASQRLQTFEGLAESFGAFADQAGVARRGRRGQRTQLARNRAEIQSLLARARTGDDEAIQALQRLLPETLALGQQTLSGGRFRALAGQLEAAGLELEDLSESQVDLAEQQLTELRAISEALAGASTREVSQAKDNLAELARIAAALGVRTGDLKTAADLEAERARLTLVALGAIATGVSGAAGTALGTANQQLEDVKSELAEFRDDIAPVLSYLQGRAGSQLGEEFLRLANLLGEGEGAGSPILKALREVRDRLPPPPPPPPPLSRQHGGPAFAGQLHLVGEHGAELFIPSTNGVVLPNGRGLGGMSVTITGPFVFNFPAQQPLTRATASEFGRTSADAFTQRVLQVMRRESQRRVA